MTLMNEVSRRRQLREWLKEELEYTDSVCLPEITDQAVEHFISDPSFMRGALRDVLRPMINDMAQRILHRTRHGGAILLGDEVVARSEFDQRAQVFASRFSSWMEHAGDRYVNFMLLTREQLRKSVQARMKRLKTEAHIVRFQKEVLDELRPGQQVKERFGAQELEDLWERTQGTGSTSTKEVA